LPVALRQARARLNTRNRGQLAEQVAVDQLVAHGYRIVERNFLCKLGEIDIIARHNGDLVFVEVRSGKRTPTFDPIFSVDRKKQEKIIRTAQIYLDKHFRTEPTSRFDVVLVTLGDPPSVEIIPDAFNLDFQ
jgi:putative endonuclease